MSDRLAQEWLDAWSSHDRVALGALCAADVHYEDPFTPEPLSGREQLGRHAARLWAGFPDARLERAGPVMRDADGRHLTIPARLTATHRDELEGLPATGRFVVVQLVFVAELDEAGVRLWRVRTFLDAYDAAVQLGVLPKPGTLGERALLLLRGFGLKRG